MRLERDWKIYSDRQKKTKGTSQDSRILAVAFDLGRRFAPKSVQRTDVAWHVIMLTLSAHLLLTARAAGRG